MGESGEYRARVGVWLMPNNRQEGDRGEGTLEGFLETLVREEDPAVSARTRGHGAGED